MNLEVRNANLYGMIFDQKYTSTLPGKSPNPVMSPNGFPTKSLPIHTQGKCEIMGTSSNSTPKA